VFDINIDGSVFLMFWELLRKNEERVNGSESFPEKFFKKMCDKSVDWSVKVNFENIYPFVLVVRGSLAMYEGEVFINEFRIVVPTKLFVVFILGVN
jgi:hypothetical protein